MKHFIAILFCCLSFTAHAQVKDSELKSTVFNEITGLHRTAFKVQEELFRQSHYIQELKTDQEKCVALVSLVKKISTLMSTSVGKKFINGYIDSYFIPFYLIDEPNSPLSLADMPKTYDWMKNNGAYQDQFHHSEELLVTINAKTMEILNSANKKALVYFKKESLKK